MKINNIHEFCETVSGLFAKQDNNPEYCFISIHLFKKIWKQRECSWHYIYDIYSLSSREQIFYLRMKDSPVEIAVVPVLEDESFILLGDKNSYRNRKADNILLGATDEDTDMRRQTSKNI